MSVASVRRRQRPMPDSRPGDSTSNGARHPVRSPSQELDPTRQSVNTGTGDRPAEPQKKPRRGVGVSFWALLLLQSMLSTLRLPDDLWRSRVGVECNERKLRVDETAPAIVEGDPEERAPYQLDEWRDAHPFGILKRGDYRYRKAGE